MTENNKPSLVEAAKKNWIAVIGAMFFIAGLMYLLKVLFEEVEVPAGIKVGLGLAAGLGLTFFGFQVARKGKEYMGETIAGFGLALVYGTLAWAVIGNVLQLPQLAMLFITGVFSIAVIYISSLLRLRILASLGLMAGAYCAFLVEPVAGSILPVVIYLLAINFTGVWLSLTGQGEGQSGWPELRIIPFVMTILLIMAVHGYDYSRIYKHGQWEAWTFLSVFCGMYYFVYFLRSIRSQSNQFSADLFLNVLNLLVFLIGAISLCIAGRFPAAIPMILTGAVTMVSGVLLYPSQTEKPVSANLHMIFGGLLFLISAFSIEKIQDFPGMVHVARTVIWVFLIFLLLGISRYIKAHSVFVWAAGTFFFALLYWYGNAWDVEWFPIFGIKYIPFLNPGAVVWFLLAGSGFLLAAQTSKLSSPEQLRNYGFSQNVLRAIFLLASHLIVLGLLTVQLSNVWDAYELGSSSLQVTWLHSLVWIAYSLVLFFTASTNHEKFFSTSASVLLLFTCIKVIFFDLSGQSNLVRALFLLALGGMMMGIAFLLQKRLREKEAE